jgi:nitroreductase
LIRIFSLSQKTTDSQERSGNSAASYSWLVELMHHRRAVRVFDGTQVPEELMRECLELTMLTPSSSNLQPWELHWIRSEELRAPMVRALINQPAARTAAELVICVARTATWGQNSRRILDLLKTYGNSVSEQNLRYYAEGCTVMYNQGRFGWRGFLKRIVNRIVGMQGAVVRRPSSLADMRVWAVKSAAMACQTLIIALQARGFDTCPLEGMDDRRISKILHLPGDAVVVMAIAVGKRSYNGVIGPRIRLPSSEFIKEI